MKKYESSEILKKAFLSLKQSDGLSLRKWSDLVGINSSTLTLIINSKRLVPQKHLKKIAESLDFDRMALEKLKRAHSRDWMRSRGLSSEAASTKAFEDNEIEEVDENDSILLKSWLHLALLEFSTCVNFHEEQALLAKQFQVSVKQVNEVLSDLERAGYLVREGNRLVKKHKKMRLPTKRSREVIRNFHLEMLRKAMLHLQQDHDQDSFQKRLVTGYTVAANPKNLEKVKLHLEKAIVEACTELIKGHTTEVYQLQLQLFPLKKL